MERILELLAAGDPGIRQIVEVVKKIVLDHRGCHKACDIGNIIECDLFYDMIEAMHDREQEAIIKERLAMLCGHPQACKPAGAIFCMACMSEQRVVERLLESLRK